MSGVTRYGVRVSRGYGLSRTAASARLTYPCRHLPTMACALTVRTGDKHLPKKIHPACPLWKRWALGRVQQVTECAVLISGNKKGPTLWVDPVREANYAPLLTHFTGVY